MTHPTHRRWFLSSLVLAATLTACASTGKSDRIEIYQSDDNYVRLEPIEPGTGANAHPFTISTQQLRELLAPLKVSRADSGDRTSVFLNEELDTIVAPLATALAKAGANQDVTFAVTGVRGILGKYSPKSITTGRLFVSENRINLIFGLMQQRLGSENLTLGGVAPSIVPGARARRIDLDPWKLDPVGGYFHDQRGDWVVFDRGALEPGRGFSPNGARNSLDSSVSAAARS